MTNMKKGIAMPSRTILLACTASLSLTGCAATGLGGVAPVTAGQSQPISATERQQGQQAYTGLTQEFGGPYTGKQATYVVPVAQRIAVQSGLSASPSAFTVTMLDSPVDNAFATPGGYIYLTRGLMALMNDEAELAAVLGHEVGHVAARHSQSRQSNASTTGILGAIGQAIAGSILGSGAAGQLAQQVIGTGAQLATLGYSRGQESQADDLGVQYLKTANYDTDALASVLASLAAQNDLDARISGETRSTPAFASTHPDPQSRVRVALADAQQVGGTEQPRNRDVFLNAVDGILYGDDPKQGVIQGRDFLQPALRVAFTIPDGYKMQNGAQAVTIAGSGAQAKFTTAAYSGNIETYVQQQLQALGSSGSVPQGQVQRTTVNGVPAAYTTVRANTENGAVDASIFAYAVSSSKAYHFVILTAAGQGITPVASMVQSFRPLTAAQAAAVKSKFIRVVTVKSGDTPTSLAARMQFDDYKLERFLVLNGLSNSATLRAGDRVKIVTY